MKLYSKIVIGGLLASLVAGEGIIIQSRKAVHSALVSQIRMDGEREFREIASGLVPGIRSADERRILPALHEYMNISGAIHAAVLDAEGLVLAHSNVAEAGKIYRDAETAADLRSARMDAREVVIDGRSALRMTFPVFDESEAEPDEDFLLADAGGAGKGARIGTLRVAMSLDKALAAERDITGSIVLAVLFLGGAAGLCLFFFMRHVLAPIGLLSAATEKIRGGDYRTVVPVTSKDEIGELARGFNAMSRELERTTVSKDFFNGILDSIQDLVIVTDAAGCIVLVNPAAVKLLGYSKEELVGRPGASLLEGEQASFLAPAHNAAAHFIAKSQEGLSVLFSSSPLTGADGSVTGYIGAAKDVTDLRRIEARMRQSEKLSAVGQLAAGVAHEINNPLGVILGFAQTLARQLSEDDPLELPIRSIEREALRCKALVQNLLTFARTSQADRAPMDLNAAVVRALELIAPHAKISRIAVSTDLARGLPPVLGNMNQLEQVVMNLAKNAIDAMPNGGSLLLSSELDEQGAQSWVRLKCVDDGIGIPPATATKIFDPFFTTKPIGQGTGLGLSLVSEIVQKHSGEISVDSRPGRTVFTVRLPVRTGRERDLPAAVGPKGTISHG